MYHTSWCQVFKKIAFSSKHMANEIFNLQQAAASNFCALHTCGRISKQRILHKYSFINPFMLIRPFCPYSFWNGLIICIRGCWTKISKLFWQLNMAFVIANSDPDEMLPWVMMGGISSWSSLGAHKLLGAFMV